MRVVFVHGACVNDGAWWWHLAANALHGPGLTSTAPALPSCGETGIPAGPDGAGLAEDVLSVREALLAKDEPVVLVAHSYGGIVAAEAAAGVAAVRHMLLISSYLPEPGESLSTFGADTPPPFLDFDLEGGTFSARHDTFANTFAQDCLEEIVFGGLERLARQSLSVLQQPVSAAAWHDIPTTYLVCTDDRGTPESAQREFARRANNVLEIGAGHHPFLSQPHAVAEIITDLK